MTAGNLPINYFLESQRAVAKLEEECSVITYQDAVWAMPPGLEWDDSFYQDSILLFPDSHTLAQFLFYFCFYFCFNFFKL